MHLGPAEYRVLLALCDGPAQARVEEEELRLEDGRSLYRTAVGYLASERLLTISDRGDGPSGVQSRERIGLALTEEGHSTLDQELGRAWIFDRTGTDPRPPTLWFEFPDVVTGRRFVVNVRGEEGHHRATQLALMVGRDPEARAAARQIDEPGLEEGIDWRIDGATVWIWRRS